METERHGPDRGDAETRGDIRQGDIVTEPDYGGVLLVVQGISADGLIGLFELHPIYGGVRPQKYWPLAKVRKRAPPPEA